MLRMINKYTFNQRYKYAKYYEKGEGGMASWGKNGIGERIKEENHIKKGGKGLKNASFWAIKNDKKKNIYLY